MWWLAAENAFVLASVRRAFVAASITWTALLVVVPFLASRPHASTPGTALVVAVYGIGSFVCHQLAERSYRLWSAQMPVCARCTGIYFGAAVAAAIVGARGAPPGLATRRTGRPAIRQGGVTRRHARTLLAAAVAPTVATLVYEWTTGDVPSNGLRCAAGVPIGVAVVWLIVSVSGE